MLILLDNALDHSPEGAPVDVAVGARDGMAEVRVTDRGPGIPPTMRERIFEPFVRLPGVPRVRGRSTGLGLSIARRIAAAHGGSTQVEDAPDGGARFVVRLPLQAPAAFRRRPVHGDRPAGA